MSDYSDIFGREPEPWREPLGALRLTLTAENPPSWQIERARAECEALVKVLNESAALADQGKPQITENMKRAVLTVDHIAQSTGMTAAEVVATINSIGKPQITVTDAMIQRAREASAAQFGYYPTIEEATVILEAALGERGDA